MSRLNGCIIKRIAEIEKELKGASYVEFIIMDKDTDEILKEVTPDKKPNYQVIFRI